MVSHDAMLWGPARYLLGFTANMSRWEPLYELIPLACYKTALDGRVVLQELYHWPKLKILSTACSDSPFCPFTERTSGETSLLSNKWCIFHLEGNQTAYWESPAMEMAGEQKSQLWGTEGFNQREMLFSLLISLQNMRSWEGRGVPLVKYLPLNLCRDSYRKTGIKEQEN